MDASLPFESLPHSIESRLAPTDAITLNADGDGFHLTRDGRRVLFLANDPPQMATMLRAFAALDAGTAEPADVAKVNHDRTAVVVQTFRAFRETWIRRGWDLLDSSPSALVKDDRIIGVVVTLLVTRPLGTADDLLAELEFVATTQREWVAPELERGNGERGPE